jgi:hypothetical protein
MYQALLLLFVSFGRWSLGTRLVDVYHCTEESMTNKEYIPCRKQGE